MKILSYLIMNMNPRDIVEFNRRQKDRYAKLTGIRINIQDIGKNDKLIAVRESKSLREVRPGVWLRKDVAEFEGNFSNVYDLTWDPNQVDLSPGIHSADKPYFLTEQMRKDPSSIAIMNGSFFFLTDQAEKQPPDLPYDLCIRNGKIIGLPSADQPILFIQDDKLSAAEPKATGEILIGNKKIIWVGVQSSHPKRSSCAILYNSKCANIMKFRDPETNVQIGVLDNKTATTPMRKNSFDLVVNKDRNGNLKVTKINPTGGTHYYEGLFILQIKEQDQEYKIGDMVMPLTLDGLNLGNVTSALTIGKRVNDPLFFSPEREDKRDARSLIAQDITGFMHFIVFDGSKYIPGFNGVSAKDIVPLFPKEEFTWAYFLDGGGSSRIILKEEEKLHFLANVFVFRKLGGAFLWDWENGRIVGSSISLRLKSS